MESVAELFSGLGHGGGVAIEEPILSADETGRVEYDLNGLVTVKTYVPEGEGSDESIRRAEEGLWHLSQMRRVEGLGVNRIAEQDWEEAWKKFFHVQRIGERTVIKPSWREYEAREGEVVLELDPGMAFGTGLHPTTRACLRAASGSSRRACAFWTWAPAPPSSPSRRPSWARPRFWRWRPTPWPWPLPVRT